MNLNEVKATATAVAAFLASILGILYVPVLLMVACNVIDYATGLMAISTRDEKLSSYRSLRGIIKKVGMWLLVVVGAIVDELIAYAGRTIGMEIPIHFLVACVVTVWIICSELISILENLIDIGVNIPPFLMPIVELIKKQTEEKAKISTDAQNEDASEV